MLRTQIYLPEDLHRRLLLISDRENVSMAQLIRRFIKTGLSHCQPKKNSGRTLLKLVKMSVKGLPKDLSSRHDFYLYGGKK